MDIAISTHLFLYHDLLDGDVFKAIRDAGFNKIEIWAMKPHFPYDDPGKIAALGTLSSRTGVSFWSAHLPMYIRVYRPGRPEGLISPSSEDDAIRKRWKEEAGSATRAAAELGAKYFTLHANLKFPGPDPRRDIFSRSLAAFVAEDLPRDAVLGVENDAGGPEQIDGLNRAVSDQDSSRVGITLDLGHAFMGHDVLASISKSGPRLKVIHAHDNNGHEDAHLPPRRGKMPWDEVKKALEEARFSGPFVWEIRDPAGGIPRGAGLKVLKEILKEIKEFDLINS